MSEIGKRVTQYLEAGGLFNPEMMEHDKVRDLLIDCRDALTRLQDELHARDNLIGQLKQALGKARHALTVVDGAYGTDQQTAEGQPFWRIDNSTEIAAIDAVMGKEQQQP